MKDKNAMWCLISDDIRILAALFLRVLALLCPLCFFVDKLNAYAIRIADGHKFLLQEQFLYSHCPQNQSELRLLRTLLCNFAYETTHSEPRSQ